MEDVEVITIDTQPAANNLKELRAQLKKVKDEMVTLDEGSDAFLEAANKAGELKHQLDEINESVKGASADFGDILGNVSKVGAGITGMFQTMTASLSLFGVESEEIVKSIKTMQNLMAITQGLDSIDQAVKSIDKLRNSITATTTSAKVLKAVLTPKTILLLTAALTALFILWDKFISKLEPVQKAISGLKGVFSNFGAEIKSVGIMVMNSLVAPFETVFKLIGGIGKTISSVVKGEFSNIKGIFEETKESMLKPWKKISDDAAVVGKEFSKGFNQGVAAEENARKQEAEKQRQEKLAKYRKQQEAYYDLQRARAEATIQNEKKLNQELIRIETTRLSLYKKGTLEYYNQLKKVNELKKSNATETAPAEDKEISILYAKLEYQKASNKEYAQSKKAIEDYLFVQQMELASLKKGSEEWYKLSTAIANTKNTLANFGKKSTEDILNEQLAAIELTEKSLDLSFAQGKLTEIDYNTKILEQEKQKLALLKEGTMEWYNQSLTVEQYKKKLDESDNALTNFQKGLEMTNQIGQIAFGALSDTLGAFADMQDTTTKEGFEQQKKLQIAQVTMNMLGGVLSAWTSAMSPANEWMTIFGQIAMGTAQSIATLAMGAAQIQKIKQTTFNGGGASAGGAASVNPSVISSISAPVQYSNVANVSDITSQIKDTRVVVVESDITNTQRRVSVAEDENRY